MKMLGLTDDEIGAWLSALQRMGQVVRRLRGSRRSTTTLGTADKTVVDAVDARGAHASTPTSCSTRGGWTIT